jgi:hypothetical protein
MSLEHTPLACFQALTVVYRISSKRRRARHDQVIERRLDTLNHNSHVRVSEKILCLPAYIY